MTTTERPADPSDETLMRTYVDGDQDAFAELFRRYGGPVTRRMQRSVGTGSARDLTQQTFLQFHRSRQDFRVGAAVRPWLMTIARNVLRDHLRRSTRRPGSLPLLDDPVTVSSPAEAREVRAVVLEAVDQLPESQRIVVRGHWLEHRSHADIARELGISRGAVKVRAHRAYQTLRRVLSAKGYEVR
jgi:RNA polymerase sigma-70 factor, ECF subfamily